MKRISKGIATSTLVLALAGGIAAAQDHHDDRDRHDQYHHDQYVRHDDWKRGRHIRHEDWDRGRHIDNWRARHLRRPPAGYEWRELDGQYVLANTDGVIFQVVIPH